MTSPACESSLQWGPPGKANLTITCVPWLIRHSPCFACSHISTLYGPCGERWFRYSRIPWLIPCYCFEGSLSSSVNTNTWWWAALRILVGSVSGKLLFSFAGIVFPWFSHSLKSCIAVITFTVVISSSLTSGLRGDTTAPPSSKRNASQNPTADAWNHGWYRALHALFSCPCARMIKLAF